MPTCPHCKNTDPVFFEDNGVRKSDADFTIICLAPVRAGEEANDDPPTPGVCGMQWEPNEKADAAESVGDRLREHGRAGLHTTRGVYRS